MSIYNLTRLILILVEAIILWHFSFALVSDIDVTVHHTLILFEKIENDLRSLVKGLKSVQNLIPALNLL